MSGETKKRDYLWESNLWGHQSKLKVRLLAGTGIMEEDCVVGAEPMKKMKASQILLLEIFPKTREGKTYSGFSLISTIQVFHHCLSLAKLFQYPRKSGRCNSL